MSEFVVPSLEEIAAESDRTVLADIASAIKAYGASLKDNITPENLDTLRELSTRLDAIDARVAELAAAEEAAKAAEAELAAEIESIVSKFDAVETTAVEETVEAAVEPTVQEVKPEPRELRIPIMSKGDKEVLAVENPATETAAAAVKRFLVQSVDGAEVKNTHELANKLIKAHQEAYRLRGALPGRENIKVFSSQVNTGAELTDGMDEVAALQFFRDVVIPSAKAAADESVHESLVASGGYCAPLNTDYNIPVYAEICDTIESFLPSVQAPRGGIKFIRPGSDTTAAGIAVITCAEDAAGYVCETPAGTTACKPTTSVTCPTTEEACVDMISQSIQFGNLNYRTFPEHIDWALHHLAVNFNRVKQQYLLDKVNDPSNVTVVTSNTARYNAVSDLVNDLIAISVAFRNANKMCYNSGVLNIMLPKYVADLLKIDLVGRETGLDYMNVTEATIADWFRTLGFNPFFYEGKPTGQAALPTLTAGQPVAKLPKTGRAFIFEPGSFVILRGGTLDLGVVRDSALNHANKLEMFSEEFIGLARVGLKAIAYDFSLDVTSSFAAATTKVAYV